MYECVKHLNSKALRIHVHTHTNGMRLKVVLVKHYTFEKIAQCTYVFIMYSFILYFLVIFLLKKSYLFDSERMQNLFSIMAYRQRHCNFFCIVCFFMRSFLLLSRSLSRAYVLTFYAKLYMVKTDLFKQRWNLRENTVTAWHIRMRWKIEQSVQAKIIMNTCSCNHIWINHCSDNTEGFPRPTWIVTFVILMVFVCVSYVYVLLAESFYCHILYLQVFCCMVVIVLPFVWDSYDVWYEYWHLKN